MPDSDDMNTSLNLTYCDMRPNTTSHSISVLEPIDTDEQFNSANHAEMYLHNENILNTDKFVFDDLKHTISTILEDTACFSDASSENARSKVEGDDNAFLSNIYNLFLTMNEKIDKINLSIDSTEGCKSLFRKICANMSLGDVPRAQSQLRDLHFALFNDVNIDSKSQEALFTSLKGLRQQTVPRIFETLKGVSELAGKWKDRSMQCRDVLESQSRELEKLKAEKAEVARKLEADLRKTGLDLEGREKQVDLLHNYIADVNHFISGHPINFLDDKEVKRFFARIKDDIKILKDENSELKTQYKELKSQPKESESRIKKEIEKYEGEMSKLREENTRITGQINKIVEKHVRYKKEMVTLSKDLTKIKDNSKRKSEIIEKQKRIINLLQRRASDTSSRFPIDDVEEKIKRLKASFESETDIVRRKKIVGEIAEYERLLSDFVFLKNKS